MIDRRAFSARRIFDGRRFHENKTLLIDRAVVDLIDRGALPAGIPLIDTGADILSPGFIDWQVNGGGGVLLNEDPTVDGISRIARAHLSYGTTALLPTVITDHPKITRAAAQAVRDAVSQGVDGVVGIHFEGPHIAVEKKGVHEPSFIRPMLKDDLELYSAGGMGCVLITLGPENTSLDQIHQLVAKGVIVSLGHTTADYEAAKMAFAAGARAVTHLFNAMAPMLHRAPGLIGAAMENPEIFCGIIPDGHHVHPAALRMIFANGPISRLTLVTDAMSLVGDNADSFELNGRRVCREDGRLTLLDGTLAGSDLDMISGIRYVVEKCGVAVEDALQMATFAPATMLGLSTHGKFARGARADILALSENLEIQDIWLAGKEVKLS
ncbi:N-acetylglucosamine-6-phosphate deacetylase [Limoniibacter endophyticus]|uniref:N-acetylglucosamine-6-phosphate deacetylase n=1 Tax=Limoniibacter endophyticus TaxID=1565040 RepID=A0A8J3DKK6_9HYPH|nr:N-acetylglucosamine-6-phosphate deacetylase [Limoniibacter endophyticus]GHC78022.1 N-acetylglucosamine-6-phosphate deacetylase [Limoniibacter endophyticus]